MPGMFPHFAQKAPTVLLLFGHVGLYPRSHRSIFWHALPAPAALVEPGQPRDCRVNSYEYCIIKLLQDDAWGRNDELERLDAGTEKSRSQNRDSPPVSHASEMHHRA